MKLTIEIDDELVRKAERIAEERGRTLDAVIGEALEQATSRNATNEKPKAPAGTVDLPVYRATPGKEGFRPGVDIRRNAAIWEILDETDAGR